MKISVLLAGIFLLCCLAGSFSHPFPFTPFLKTKPKAQTQKSKYLLQQELGRQLFFDTNLSNPTGQSCASCHAPGKGFADPQNRVISAGANAALFGNRNASSAAYAAFNPPLYFDSAEQHYVGGFFWDGRAKTLAEQATGPLLNHVEMNSSKGLVLARLQQATYRDLFVQTYGKTALHDPDQALFYVGQAIAAFEETPVFSPFTSKFDYYMQGKVALNKEELRGLQLFNDPAKGNCAACHPSEADARTGKILFTDYTYDNLGLPANPEIRKLQQNRFEPDLGLGAIVKKTSENGKFKVPTLRNVALTAPYFHNGFSKTLEEAVQFYNQRDSGKFGLPEIPENVNREELGNLRLTDQEVKAIVAFMNTLTDGYRPE